MALGARSTQWARAASLAAALAAGVSPALADTLTYTNSRFGTSVTFPAEVFGERMDPPQNGDGMTWTAPDGGSLAVFAFNNALAVTPETLADENEGRDDVDVTYRRVGKDWVVLSGYEKGMIFYQRFEFGADDVIHSVLLKYPQSARETYDDLAGPIAGSLQGP